jgi:uncharacterized protein YndB with AHSA1/START domain
MPHAQCTMLIEAPRQRIFDAFTQPADLAQFWLTEADAPLAVGQTATWHFMVPGAKEQTTATALNPPNRVAFTWSDGVSVDISIEPFDEERARVVIGIDTPDADRVADAVEGFTLVLSELKLWLETGSAPGLVRAKAELIAAMASKR